MKSWIYAILFCFSAQFLTAQVKFQTKVSQKEVQIGQRFRVEFVLNQKGSGFKPPSFEGFQVLGRPEYNVRTSLSNTGRSIELSYSYILSAKELGEFKIEPATIKVKGEVYRTEPVIIKVLKQRSKAQSRNQELVFLEATVSKRKVYQGEPIYGKYRLYYRTTYNGLSIVKQPDFQGFFYSKPQENSLKIGREVLDGQEYAYRGLDELVIIPSKAGTFKPGELEISTSVLYRTGGRNVFGQPNTALRELKTSVDFPSINVKPLPSKGRPQNFSGAVGNFKMDVDLSATEVNIDGSISLKIRIEGNGNIELCDLPKIEFPSAFEVFDPEIKERSAVGPYGMRGYKEIEYLLVPRYSGTYKLEPIQFSYFDPKKEKYFRLESEAYEININGGPQQAKAGNSKTPAGEVSEAVDFINKDILFIKTTNSTWKKQGHQFLASSAFWLILAALVLIALGLIAWWLRNRTELKNRDSLRVQRAGKLAQKKLRKAQKALKDGDAEAFYQELETALYGFFSDKWNVGTSAINKDYLQEQLKRSGAEEPQIKSILQLLEKSEMARYTGLKIDAAQQDFELATRLLTEIDKHL